jgi:MFS superfamily sulfate permease-like transporter
MWKKLFPPFQLDKCYSGKHLQSDAFAGVTLTVYFIPVSMVYESLA